ncbi:Hypothetical predicted protein [Olea europaea subsp. europaea]|uniref:Uncharacterized protein n=1 Tax=Olea europaea subsp. europaea TaxID=158383 RepID=A0A8S0STM0_OLEEU|nr:Hypothetical predicted protein [Olea europaea subsp. europaea]
MPSKQVVVEKRDATQKASTFVYSVATVKQMFQEKKTATWVPLNMAAEKDRLRRELEVAEMRDDEVEVERIKARLQEPEERFRGDSYYYLSNSGGEAAAGDAIAVLEIANSNGGEVSAEAGMATTAAADAGKLVDTRAPVDQGTVNKPAT